MTTLISSTEPAPGSARRRDAVATPRLRSVGARVPASGRRRPVGARSAPSASQGALWRTRFAEEFGRIRPRLRVGLLVARVLPEGACSRVRTAVLRAAGVAIGPGTTFDGAVRISGGTNPVANLTIGRGCYVNVDCTLDVTAPVTIGDGVYLAQEVMVITGSHEIDGPRQRAGGVTSAPVRICDGAWLGARALVLPGVTVGHGAVVAAGAVVTRDVPADTVVAGVPARVVRDLRPSALR